MKRIARSLSSKLSLDILLLAVPIFVVSLGILFMQSRYIVRKEAVQRANSVLNTTLQRANVYIRAVETATNINSWLAEQYFQPDSLLSISRRVVSLNPHIDGCSISAEPNTFPEYGRYFSAYTIKQGDSIITVVEEEYEYFEKGWYKLPHDLRKTCWVDFYDETNLLKVTLDGMIASFCKPLYKADSTMIGIISTDLSLLHLSKVLNSDKPYPNSYFVMTGEEGRYLLHPDTTKLFTHTIFGTTIGHDDPTVTAPAASPSDAATVSDASPSGILTLADQLIQRQQGSMSVVIDGTPCLVSYQPVPGTPWSLALVCPDSDILSNYHQLALVIVPLFIIGLIIILWLSRRAVSHSISPLAPLMKKTQSIAEGNYEVHIPRSEREDAVGRLQNSFATMLQSLNFHMGSVRYTATQTEERNKELLKATQLAEEADRQKTLFIQNVTHQIRTPLNIVMGFSQILLDTIAPADSLANVSDASPSASPISKEEMKNIADTMLYNARLLNRLVLMLFDSSDTGFSEELLARTKIDQVSCNDVAREAIEYIKVYYPDLNVEIRTTVPDELCIQTNRLYLLRSLREILYNSAKYSDKEHVSISILKSCTPQSQNSIRFIVEDKGKGIDVAERERMFKFFAKIDDLSEGLGLGLPLAKRHACNLGGDLTLDADYHDGCRFILELPL